MLADYPTYARFQPAKDLIEWTLKDGGTTWQEVVDRRDLTFINTGLKLLLDAGLTEKYHLTAPLSTSTRWEKIIVTNYQPFTVWGVLPGSRSELCPYRMTIQGHDQGAEKVEFPFTARGLETLARQLETVLKPAGEQQTRNKQLIASNQRKH